MRDELGAEPCLRNRSGICLTKNSRNALPLPGKPVREEICPVGTSIWRWPSPNSPIARARATSKPACAQRAAGCTRWVFAAAWRADDGRCQRVA